jgi:O-antigen ligase
VAAGLLADELRRGRGWKDPLVCALPLSMVVLSLGVTSTGSRAGFGLLMLAVLAMAVLLRRGRTGPPLQRSLTFWLRSTGIVAFLAIVQYTLLGLLLRLEQDPFDDLRWTFASRTLAAARTYAGVGSGLGTFTEAYYRLGELTADHWVLANHAHNDYLELWLEGGVVAIVLLLWVLVVLGRQWIRVARRTEPAAEGGSRRAPRGMEIGCGLALLLIALHSLVDYPIRTPAIACLAGVLAGVLMSVRTDSRDPQTP